MRRAVARISHTRDPDFARLTWWWGLLCRLYCCRCSCGWPYTGCGPCTETWPCQSGRSREGQWLARQPCEHYVYKIKINSDMRMWRPHLWLHTRVKSWPLCVGMKCTMVAYKEKRALSLNRNMLDAHINTSWWVMLWMCKNACREVQHWSELTMNTTYILMKSSGLRYAVHVLPSARMSLIPCCIQKEEVLRLQKYIYNTMRSKTEFALKWVYSLIMHDPSHPVVSMFIHAFKVRLGSSES